MFANAKLAYKLLVPILILLGMTGTIVFVAQDGIRTLRLSTAEIVNVHAVSKALGQTILSDLNGASVQEKALMIDTDPQAADDARRRFGVRIEAALAGIDFLAGLAPTPERKAGILVARDKMFAFRRDAEESIALAQSGDLVGARRLSLTKVMRSRREIVDILETGKIGNATRAADLLSAQQADVALGGPC